MFLWALLDDHFLLTKHLGLQFPETMRRGGRVTHTWIWHSVKAGTPQNEAQKRLQFFRLNVDCNVCELHFGTYVPMYVPLPEPEKNNEGGGEVKG